MPFQPLLEFRCLKRSRVAVKSKRLKDKAEKPEEEQEAKDEGERQNRRKRKRPRWRRNKNPRAGLDRYGVDQKTLRHITRLF